MKKELLLLFAAICVSSCQKENHYPTYEDAVKSAAHGPVWLPDFIPQAAVDIAESHDIETSELAVTFSTPSEDFLEDLSKLPESLSSPAREIIDSVDFPRYSPKNHENYYYYCANQGVGLLTKDVNSSRFFYFEPIRDRKWVHICTKRLNNRTKRP